MIAWTNPAALWALLLAAGPVIVHLLRRHRAVRLPFPTLRFVRHSETSAVRLRPPTDAWLLLVRVVVVTAAVCAAAGPIALTGARLSHWNTLTARGIVVDASESMDAAGTDGVAAARLADEVAQAEARSSTYSRRIDAANLADGIRRAAAWTAAAPPARREVVVITDAQRGALDAHALHTLPAGTGVRVVAVGRRQTERRVDGPPLLASAARSRRQRVAITTNTTAVTIDEGPLASGMRIAASDERADRGGARAIEVAARAGSLAPSPDQPIAFGFGAPASGAAPVSPLQSGWMLSTALAVMSDGALASIAAGEGEALDERFGRPPWTTLLARDGKPLISAAASGQELVLQAGAAPHSVLAAAVIRSAFNGRPGAVSYAEQEVAATAPATLAAWQRPAAPVGREAWRQAESTDARWCWAVALLALALEQWLRGRSRRRSSGMTEDVRAAA